MEVTEKVYDWFWSESFWLPPNVTWADMNDDRIFIPRPRDLWAPFPIAVGLFVLRLIFERFIALPIGRRFALKETPPRPPVPNDVLEKAFKEHKKMIPDHTKLVELSKKSDLETRQIERWWRRRKGMNKSSEMTRWKETSWRFLFYLTAFWYGIYILYQKPWFWDTKHCWYGYPKQEVTDDVYWYYMVELGFYWSLVLSLFMDVRRKDFWEMIIHHIATILLLTMSYADNMIRVGTLVLVVHDAVDYWMEGAKLAKYARYNKLCDVLFVIFTIVWFVTRLVIYPARAIYSASVECYTIIGDFGALYVFNGLLIVLQILHVIWFYMILSIAKKFIIQGTVEKDERSETEAESSDGEITDGEDQVKKNVNGNNNVKDSMIANGKVNGTSRNRADGSPVRTRSSKIPMRQSTS